MKIQKMLVAFLILTLLCTALAGVAESIAALSLPAALRIIDEEAFLGSTSIGKVIVPEGTTEIRSRAFADSSLSEIVLPESIDFIDASAFDGCAAPIATVVENSYAHTWCIENGIAFQIPGTPLEILSHPQDAAAPVGSTVEFAADASGYSVRYMWQTSADGGLTWQDSGVYEAVLSLVMSDALHGTLVRCVISDGNGETAITGSARAFIEGVPEITLQPADVLCADGDQAVFTIAAEGAGLTFAWQYSDDDGLSWLDADAQGESWTVTAEQALHGRMVRCVVTDSAGCAAVSETASLLIESLLTVSISQQPQDALCSIGDTVALTVKAEGFALHYQWQYSLDGSEWIDLDASGSTLELTVTEEMFSRTYRCRIWDDYGNVRVTDEAALFDESILILSQPKSWTGCESDTAFFEVVVLDSVVSCQWQISVNNGASWSNSSIVNPYCATTATAAKNGWLYRCVVTDGEGRQQISDEVLLTVTDVFSIAAQPTSLSGELGESVTFSIQAGGTDVVFEWQRSTDGETWSTIATNYARVSQTVSLVTIGRYYRCVLTNADGSTLTSNTVQLTLNRPGFFDYNDNRYYAKEDGRLASGLETIGSDLYCFTNGGTMLTGLQKADDDIYYFTEDGPAVSGFFYVPTKYNTFYFGENHAAAIGWTEIDGSTYYFYDSGAMARGVTQIVGNEYYFDPDTGVQTFGMVQVGLNDYMYFLEGEDLPYAGLKEVDGALYYFSMEEADYGVSTSSMQTVDGKTYYFDLRTKQAVTGFVTYNGNVYYMGPDHAMVTDSFVTDGDDAYLFRADGTMRYGLVSFNGSRYYLDPETGAAVSGWIELDGSKLFFDPETFAAKTGLVTIDGAKYYFTAGGYMITGIVAVDGERYYITSEGKPEVGFLEINRNVYYVLEDQKVATGVVTVDGQLYYFDDYGVMRTGYRIIDDVRYYFDPETGAAVTGLVQLSNGYTYYFNGASGVGVGLTQIDGHLYYLNSSGIVSYGMITADGSTYYFDPATGQALTGWQAIHCSDDVTRTAYFDPETHCSVTGLQEIDGKLYYFSASGWAQTGRFTINDVTYYFSPGTFEAYTGWYQDADGNNSYFDGANGRLLGPGVFLFDDAYYFISAAGNRLTGLQVIDGARMYFDPVTAESVDGFVFIEDASMDNGGKVYYFDAVQDARYGLQSIDGNEYYFNSVGVMNYGLRVIDGVKYYFDPVAGVNKDGVLYSESNGYYYLFDRDSAGGVSTSAATVGGVLYVANSSGILRKGYCATGTSGLDYRVYLDDETGEQQVGLIDFTNSAGDTITYYFLENGCLTSVSAIREALNNALATDGWHVVEGLSYYVQDGAFCKGFKTIDGSTYYFSSKTGAMLSGLRRVGSSRYYFDQTTGAMQTGLLRINGGLFYFDPSTGAQVLGLTEVGGKPYYFMENGAATGTIQIGDTLYVFEESGEGKVMVDTDKTPAPVQPDIACTWGAIDGVKYFYDMDGKPMTGLNAIDGHLYFFGEDGKMQTGFVGVDGCVYYFGETGAVNGRMEIDGNEYYFSPYSFAMLTGMQKIGSALYYYDDSGVRQTGWITLATGERFYMLEDGAQTGLAVIDGSSYLFGDNGVMRTGLQSVTTADNTQITCLFGEDGAMETGFVTADGSLYYYDTATGARVTGFAVLDGAEYYFDPNTGKAATGLRNINGVYCYFDPATAQRQYGLQNVEGRIYCFTDDASGSGFASGLTVVDGKTYFFSEVNGSALSGYYTQDDVKYYFDPETGASVSGIFRRANGDAYAFREGGGIDTGWVENDGRLYFFYPATGLMAEGLASVGDKLYYFDFDSGFLRNTTVTVGGVDYSIDENGYACAVGDSSIARLINAGIENLDKGYGDESDLEEPTTLTCSQLVRHVLSTIGIDIPKGAYSQCYSLLNGDLDCEVIDDIDQARAGDLIYFTMVNCKYGDSCNFWNEIHHVGVYLGDGKILESTPVEGDSYNDGPMVRDLIANSSIVIYKVIRVNGVNDL